MAAPTGRTGGELLVLASMVAWIWYSRAALRRLSGHGDLALSGLTFAAGGPGGGRGGRVALLLGLARPRLVLDELNIAALLWMSMIAIGLSVPLWFTSARMLGITIAAIHTNLAPFYVMLMALAFGGAVSPRQVVGAVLVAAGALLAQLTAGRAPAAGATVDPAADDRLQPAATASSGTAMPLERYRSLVDRANSASTRTRRPRPPGSTAWRANSRRSPACRHLPAASWRAWASAAMSLRRRHRRRGSTCTARWAVASRC